MKPYQLIRSPSFERLTTMSIYLCPTDRKYGCSWEGPSEVILDHFEQEHDDLLHFTDTFSIDLTVPSENRLFLIDEEIYLSQTKISGNTLVILLRYLGPNHLASKITYNVILKINSQYCQKNYVSATPSGTLEINLDDVFSDFEELQNIQCTLNISKEFPTNSSDNEVFLDEQEFQQYTNKTDIKYNIRRSSLEENLMTDTDSAHKPKKSGNKETTLFRSKTTSFNDSRRRKLNRAKSTISLGSINENDSRVQKCTNCGIMIFDPIPLCPCGHQLCKSCQTERCKVCVKKIPSDNNVDLEGKNQLILHPCKNKKFGCPEKLFFEDLHEHEIYCIFCTYRCPMEECSFEGQFRNLCNHLKLIHSSTKTLDSFIVVFQNIPEAFLVNEEKGIFYCLVKYYSDSVLWEAKYCGPKERPFLCELNFKDGKLKKPLILKRKDNICNVKMSVQELKQLKLKAKNAILTVTC